MLRPSAVVTKTAPRSDNAGGNAPSPKTAERRQSERTPAKGMHSLLGEVLDISESGALIHHRGGVALKNGDCLTVLIRHGSYSVVVRMRIARTERTGFRRHNYGVQFLELDEEQRIALGLLADAAHDAYVGPQAYVG
jgi:hypothetical protein